MIEKERLFTSANEELNNNDTNTLINNDRES